MLSTLSAIALSATQLIAVCAFSGSPALLAFHSFEGQAPSRKTTRSSAQKPDASKDEVLTNDSVIQLLKAGLDEDLIITKIQKTKHNFDISTNGLVALKQAGASSRLIKFMMDTSKPVAPKTPTEDGNREVSPQGASNRAADWVPSTRAAADVSSGESPAMSKEGSAVMLSADELALASSPYTEEVGFYLIESGKPSQLQATGFSKQKVSMFDMLGSAATMGIAKVKQKAVVRGPSASLRLKNKSPRFLLHAPEGASPGDYVVIRLQKKSKTREVLVGSASLLGGLSGGFEEKTVVKFSNTKLAVGKYLIRFDRNLEPGEYAFYPISGLQSSGAGVSASGRLYDFGIDQ